MKLTRKSILQSLNWVARGIITVILSCLVGCGGSTSMSIPPNHSSSTIVSDQSTTLNAAILTELDLTEPVLLDSKVIPMQATDQYWIGWRDSGQNLIALSRVGTPVDLSGSEPSSQLSTVIRQQVSLNNEDDNSNGLDDSPTPPPPNDGPPNDPGPPQTGGDGSSNDSVISPTGLDLIPLPTFICVENERRELIVTDVFIEGGSETNDGENETLIVQDVYQETEDGNIIIDQNGSRPPVTINISVPTGNSTVTNPVGRTDGQGNYLTTVTLNENLGRAEFNIRASVITPEGLPLSEEREVDLEDPCTLEDLDEVFTCAEISLNLIVFNESITEEGVVNEIFVIVDPTARIPSESGSQELRDADGNLYPVDIELEAKADSLTVNNGFGTTDGSGNYSDATYVLLEDRGEGRISITATLTTPNGQIFQRQQDVFIVDLCDEGNPSEAPCDEEEDNSYSDPNYRSFDGLYSWTNSEGDFIMARTLDDQVEIQARQEQLGDTNGDSRNTDFAIRDGSDVLEFNLAQSSSAPGLILANGQLLDLTENPFAFNSGLFVTYSRSAFGGRTVPVYRVRTSTGDTFRISPRSLSLTLGSRIVSKGQFEGILGNADGDPNNDWTPRGGSPLAVGDYTTREFGDFIESWRVNGDQSLFASPYGSYIVDFSDWWSNRLSADQLRAGFQLYEQLFGRIDNSFLAFRFAVDLAGGLPAIDLQDLYERVRNLQEPPPIPPIDADLNLNGTPDVQEPQLWVFDNLLSGDEQQCINEGGFFNIETGVCLPGFQTCQDSGGFFNQNTGECVPGFQNCQFAGGIFDRETGECSFENIDCEQRGGVYDLEAEECSFPNCPFIDITAADLRLDPISPIGEFPFRFFALLTDPITRDLLFPFGQQPPIPILDYIAEGGFGDGPAEPFANNFGEIILLGDPETLRLTDEWRMRIGCGPVVFDIAGGAYIPEEPPEDESILDELICDYPAEIIEDFYNRPDFRYCDFM